MPHRLSPKRRGFVVGVAVLGAGSLAVLGPVPAATASPDSRQAVYSAAAAEYGVPESVLLAVSYLESRWDVNGGLPSTSAGYGPMHLTDAEYVTSQPPRNHHDFAEDPRGDESRPMTVAHAESLPPSTAALQTLDLAAELTGASEEALRTDPVANIRGGAALLAKYQAELGGPTGVTSDPAEWYGAVARYSGADNADAAAAFANEVYATLNEGASRVTDDGHRITLPAQRVTPRRSWLDRLGLPRKERPDGVDCPIDISCEWIPAPYEQYGATKGAYGNHDLGNRPQQQKIEYIVIHDTEGYFWPSVGLVQDPTYVSWHYTLRSVDGHIAQHVKIKDVGWHAGNWYVNAKAIGLEHEGFAGHGTWYTEAMYRTSAKLVRYLAKKYNVPLDRHHIVGHDNVPGILPANVRTMHWDPGPYWDWGHYFDLLHAPFKSTGTHRTGLVTIDPDFASNQPAFTGCSRQPPGVPNPPPPTTDPCPPRGSSAVILHTEPRHDAPLVTDIGLHPDGSPSTMYISDHGARASAGQTFAIADKRGDWTAIWYLGQKAWFYNPASAPTAKWAVGFVATPKPGRTSIPVYGRAYPEAEAYPEGVPYQAITPLQYSLPAGQRYVVGNVLPSEYYRATTFDGSSPGDWTVISGDMTYVQIQFGHRFMFVNLDDVDIRPSAVGAPH